eukprot:TRINITY_DN84591_c0_g1_i1.p1 TRINITY_DN84591_c0_g1~~TRINITY_DN84591_c0_g1_i1.p1  ORF type:complete len:217 (+),score=52.60 TRINITY_DN84591_c0_g1_i1:55-651(+)
MSDDVLALRQQLKAAEAELELKDLELRSCNPRGPHSCDDTAALREELQVLQRELESLREIKFGGKPRNTELQGAAPISDGSAGNSQGWRQRVAVLEEELRQKSEVVTRLRQRELWFELQLKRQSQMHGAPLDALLEEVLGLRDCLSSNSEVRPHSQETRGQVPPIGILTQSLQQQLKPSNEAQRLPPPFVNQQPQPRI